tara:strand:- start:1379 stop:1663 length:285 start_codon:yes stop_codon:yes gene_type:complete
MKRHKRKTVLKKPTDNVSKALLGTCTCTACGAQSQTIDAQACQNWIAIHRENCSGTGPSDCRGIDHGDKGPAELMKFRESGLAKSKPRPKIRRR